MNLKTKNIMKVAFDLDNTLIRNDFDFPLEIPKKDLFARLFGTEKLRSGTIEIFNYCKNQGWETWIYTTSFRSTLRIKTLFWVHNIRLDGVINQETHSKEVKIRSSKHPPTFGLDIIIDDSEGVKIEGERFNFEVIWLKPDNENWVQELKIQLTGIKSKIPRI
jgi:hypothetical protein